VRLLSGTVFVLGSWATTVELEKPVDDGKLPPNAISDAKLAGGLRDQALQVEKPLTVVRADGSRLDRARQLIDVVAYGASKFVRGVLPLSLGLIGGLELFAPDMLPHVVMTKDWASALFSGCVGYYGFPLMQHGKPDGGK
jgi:hypothetical protein